MVKGIPRGQYGPNHDGLLDPGRHKPGERHRSSEARLTEEKNRRRSPSPLIRALQAATDKTFRRTR